MHGTPRCFGPQACESSRRSVRRRRGFRAFLGQVSLVVANSDRCSGGPWRRLQLSTLLTGPHGLLTVSSRSRMASGCSLVPWPGEADEVADQVELHWVCWDLPGPDTWIGRATRLDKELCLVYAHPGTRRDYSAGTSDLSPRLRTAVWGEVVALPGRPTVVVLVRRVSVERFSEGRGGLRLAGRIQAPGLRRRPGAA